jgi:heme-degrading monooxygenase HmoA
MILEHAILQVRPGMANAFESAMRKAAALIAASEGFAGMEVKPCIETPGRYLLLVKWDSVEAHEKGFRGSEQYQKWCGLLHHFYEPFPVVEHYGPSITN